MATAPGLRTLVTPIFVEGDSLLDSDAVFGVKDSLVKRFERQPAGTPALDGRDLSGKSWSRVRFDIVLPPAADLRIRISEWFTPAAAAIRSTRAPSKPYLPNSSFAASMML
jgi:hypothetical protein